LENFVKNQSEMEVITMESKEYKDLIDKIDKISAFVVKCEAGIKPQSNEEIWLDSQEVANLLRISTRTLQRLRAENLISYAVLRGRCLYKLSEIERGLNERLITCDPHTLDEFRKNYLLSNGTK
jgi:hypothetical protein